MKIIEQLPKHIRCASVHNPEMESAPTCILWPDQDRQWEPIIPRLREVLPELLVYGDFSLEHLTGPAIWLKCAIAGKVEEYELPEDTVPILYLPGVGKQELRAVQNCPDDLKPLVELQYRGRIWSQVNSKDWTILAYLKSDQGGLGLDVSQDKDSRNSMQLAVEQLLDEDIQLLKGKRLDKDYFNNLMSGGDPIRDILQWMNRGDRFVSELGDTGWKALNEVCKSQLAFHPKKEGVLAAAEKLAGQQGPWKAVWDRFREAPSRYPEIPVQIRRCNPPSSADDLFAVEEAFTGWPQWNDAQEKQLRTELLALESKPPHEARKALKELEKKHSNRRELVWAELGEASLAFAIQHLAIIAEVTSSALSAGTVEDLVSGFSSNGWKADDGILRALESVESKEDVKAVTAAIRVVYESWADESARHLQKVVDGSSYPGGSSDQASSYSIAEGECVLFVDGLRFDTGKRLVELLSDAGLDVASSPVWAALPSVTATGKPAVSPVRDKIKGEDSSADFDPAVIESGKSLKGGYQLKKLLKEDGWTSLGKDSDGDGAGKAWCEFGDIDHEGHERGWKLAKSINPLLGEVRDRIRSLLDAGWKRIGVVTDHGWLLLPGGLPSVNLPKELTDNKWGRCASIKQGARTEEKLYPWYWNPNQYFALAVGISCFNKHPEYTHGGLSLQECLTLHLDVSRSGASTDLGTVQISDVVWKRLRCTVVLEDVPPGMHLDVRLEAGDKSTSKVIAVKAFKEDGRASVVVEDEDLEGEDCSVVVIDENGGLVSEHKCKIGKS